MFFMPLQSLPNWIQCIVFVLALNAGTINVLALITVIHQSVSHMTGNISMLAIDLVKWQPHTMLYLFLIVISFLMGSFCSGFILGNTPLSFHRRYGLTLNLVALLLVLTWLTVRYDPHLGLLWSSMAMGVQNAMMSHYKGAIIRTTHLSGVLTDLGLSLGYKAKGLPADRRRVILHLLIVLGFFLGGVIATIAYSHWLMNTFILPALLTVLLSAVYWFLSYEHLKRHS